MKLEGETVDIMCEVNEECEKFVTYEKGKNVPIYGMIESDLIWYDLLSTILSDLGFKLNPYEKSIANKVID